MEGDNEADAKKLVGCMHVMEAAEAAVGSGAEGLWSGLPADVRSQLRLQDALRRPHVAHALRSLIMPSSTWLRGSYAQLVKLASQCPNLMELTLPGTVEVNDMEHLTLLPASTRTISPLQVLWSENATPSSWKAVLSAISNPSAKLRICGIVVPNYGVISLFELQRLFLALQGNSSCRRLEVHQNSYPGINSQMDDPTYGMGSGFADEIAEALSQLLKADNNLQSICLEDNSLTAHGADRVRELFLDDTNIGTAGTVFAADLLRTCQLAVLSLRAAGELGDSLAHHPNIQHLSLFGYCAPCILTRAAGSSSLKSVHISNNELVGLCINDCQGCLGDALAMSTSLEKLELLSMTVPEQLINHFVGLFAKSTTLKEFILKDCFLAASHASFKHWMHGLQSAPCVLQRLDLSYSDIGDRNAQVLAAALTRNRSVLSVELELTEVSETGSVALAQMLLANSTLRTLKLGANQIPDAGAEQFAASLLVNKSLRSLDLHNNRIGSKGISALVKAIHKLLNHNKGIALQHLDLSSNMAGSIMGVDAAQACFERKNNRWRIADSMRDIL
eukprot:jgi/Chlat1/269/Chrsp1S03161